uniref:TIR domain-containing protein n=1 Tax=Anabas testudineus TaxID=64144 RepID=A0A3Q1IF04_ANATE
MFLISNEKHLGNDPFQSPILVLFVSFLVHLKPLLAYSLKNCTIDYSDDPLDHVFVDCSNRELVTVPDDLPRDVTSVKLFHNLLKKIHRKDFGNLSKLRILSLQDNQIARVDDGSFMYLSALTTLYMSNNLLTNLTAHLFYGLSSLNMLDLSYNKIQFIHISAFHFLASLQAVMLDTNKLQHLMDIRPILQLPHLKELNLRETFFPSFETKDLHNVSSGLKILHVSGDKMKKFSITTPIFPHLESLDLRRFGQVGVLKWDIPDKTFLKNITQLYLSKSLIPFEAIHKVLKSLDSLMHLKLNYMDGCINIDLLATVCKIPTLRNLDLSWNNVSSLSLKLDTCSQLTELNLSFTHMTELSKGSVQSMKRLRALHVEHNFLYKVPDDIRSLSSLKILNLSDNLISELGCDDFINTTRLTKLYLNSKHIAKLDRCVFEHLIYLNVLDLSDNLLSTIGDTFRTGPKMLMFLDLSTNFVPVFEKGDFQGLGCLKYLDIYDFTGLQQLKNLTIYFRMVSSISKVQITFKLSFIQKNVLAENIYISLPNLDIFQFNTKLKSLTIRHTDLSHLDPVFFRSIPNLEVLDFSNSKLKSLDFLAQVDLSALRYLKLTDNELTVINETVFQSLPALTYLDLDNNPFTCDCSNAGFIQWVIGNNQTQVVNAHQYTCSFPGAEQGRKLLDFDVQSCWMDVGFLCFISSTCLVVLTLLSSFIYHFLRWQLSYGFYFFLAFLYDSRKKKKGTPHQFDAFVSYNVHDEAWVYREMLPVLEEEQGWRLCLHHRDFQPGKPIMENITDAIYGSRKTICVISQHYLQSEWCSREIQMASFRLFDEHKDVLILLFLEEIPDQQLSPYYRMRKMVKRRTYLSWPQAGQHTGVFWQNVQRALETGDGPTDNNVLTGPAQC